MVRRFLPFATFICLAAITALAPVPTYGRGNDNSSEKQENREEKQESKEAEKEEKSEGKGSGKSEEGKASEGKSEGKRDEKAKEAVPVPAEAKPAVGKKDQDAARQAVEANEAIPLKEMLEIFESYGELTVVDVVLVQRHDHLAYRFKFIDPEGRVRQAYFDARTGQQVR